MAKNSMKRDLALEVHKTSRSGDLEPEARRERLAALETRRFLHGHQPIF